MPAEISTVRPSRLLLLASLGAADFCRQQRRRQIGFAVLSALTGGRCGEWVPGSRPQVKAQAAPLVTTICSLSGSSLFSAGAAWEPPGDGTSAAHSGTFTLLPTLPSSAREKTSTHLLVIRQVTRETRTPGQREEEEEKKNPGGVHRCHRCRSCKKKEVTKFFSGTSLVDKEIAWAISPYLGYLLVVFGPEREGRR
ncbi:PREDICTED: uncharacterized protein LOC109381349 isoform X2 [Hipposideros armiger]|uniref:Uncharacterized protein LOC109381349 isoform X2 n=1 Tax=Hipposideros armiger TaxID=186990 RepID=A0A8B7R490_HIPAR|nr:PREDICTED: uncharacterized protein LOC109381349 isoform X2 [Hipposideros armiger]